MRRFSLLALVLLGASCNTTRPRPSVSPAPVGSSTATSPPTTSATSVATPVPEVSRQARLIDKMLRRVELARGLKASKPIPGALLDRDALIARVKAHVTKELPPEAIRNEGLALQLLGFVPTQFDYEQAQYKLLQEQLAGYYEPADGTMYLASDLGDDDAEATLAHELVHALQDQRWDLDRRSKYRPGQGDLSEAVSALAEGDATSAMFDVMIAHAAPGSGKTAIDMPDDVFAEQILNGMNEGASASAPHVMRTSLAAPYVYGTLFVHALRRQGGWYEVDRAWDDPPTTTEQILHVEKWRAHEPALTVAPPAFAALGAGWTASDEDSEGELGVRIAYEEWMPPKEAAATSSGWGGDRGVLLTNGALAAFAWRLRYDPGKTKDDLAIHAFAARASALGGSTRKVGDPGFVCEERSDRGPLAVARAGADLIFTVGPARTSPSGPWRSVGTCGLARKWTREIAAGR
jgi:hypothetical protein